MTSEELAKLAGRRAFEGDVYAPVTELVWSVCGGDSGRLPNAVTEGVMEALAEYEADLTPRGRTRYHWERRNAESRSAS